MEREQGLAIRDGLFQRMGVVEGAIEWGRLLANDPEIYNAVHGLGLTKGVHIQNPGPDPARMTAKYLARTSAATQDYVDGMNNPRRDPKAAAIAAKGKYKQRMQEAINNDSWAKGVAAYDLGEAVRIATSDGGSAYAAGIQKRSDKIARAHQRLAPRLGGISQAIQSMPQDSPEQREQRMLANLRAMRRLGQELRGGGG
jgi:hypothetical protein